MRLFRIRAAGRSRPLPFSAARNSKKIDPVWRGKLSDAVMHVQFPVRSIFARPELSAAKLVTLQAGDIIPVCLPSHLPVTVAGRLFAHGTVGEAGGRAAIRIKNIAQGSDQNE